MNAIVPVQSEKLCRGKVHYACAEIFKTFVVKATANILNTCLIITFNPFLLPIDTVIETSSVFN